MALKLNISFPIFAPPLPPGQNPNPSPTRHRGPDEVRFSRWNNANAQRFNERRRTQEEIEADIRRYRRFDAATGIVQSQDSSSVEDPGTASFKSRGTPSLPSAPSIPGKRSKYSKPESGPKSKNKPQVPNTTPQLDSNPTVKVSEDGVSYVIDGAPFEFRYSYTETPKVKPLKLREPYAPFGPTTMGRPWTGRPPLPPSKKQLKEFDSFQLPPPDRKGVKPVQKPGPFLPGSGPRYVYKREEILGEPLTRDEIRELVKGCIKTRRQLNMGRDGLTHNMLDNIHALWKRRRVCKIKCKGVCTVDMDNVCQQLEERTGGKVIYRRGGVLFLFRGRNYNYKTRPRFPLMLWKPAAPVYPRLVKRVPEGLTLEEVSEMRRKGRELIPICKLAKNGVYCDLVKNVKEAFEVCELVRINCQGIKGSDYRKIGAKLKDLVPCVLISFENEHILIWRGRYWKSSLPVLNKNDNNMDENEDADATSVTPPSDNPEALIMDDQIPGIGDEAHHSQTRSIDMQVDQGSGDQTSGEDPNRFTNIDPVSEPKKTDDITLQGASDSSNVAQTLEDADGNRSFSDIAGSLYGSELAADNSESKAASDSPVDDQQPLDLSELSNDISKPADQRCTEKVLNLMKQAVENGSAMVLEDSKLDADNIFKKAVAFAKSAPPGPVFQHRQRRLMVKKTEKQEWGHEDLGPEAKNDDVAAYERVEKQKQKQKQSSEKRRDCLDGDHGDVVPQGSLRVDELAKLLS